MASVFLLVFRCSFKTATRGTEPQQKDTPIQNSIKESVVPSKTSQRACQETNQPQMGAKSCFVVATGLPSLKKVRYGIVSYLPWWSFKYHKLRNSDICPQKNIHDECREHLKRVSFLVGGSTDFMGLILRTV